MEDSDRKSGNNASTPYRVNDNWRFSSENGNNTADGSRFFKGRARGSYPRQENGDNRAGSSRFCRDRSRGSNPQREVLSRFPNRTEYRTDGFGGRQHAKSMGFMFLENLVKNDPEKIILTLLKERDGFLRLLEKDLSGDFVVLIIKILHQVCQSSFSDTKYTILHSSFKEKFVDKLRTFVALLPTQDALQRRTSNYFWKDPNEFLRNLIEICEDLLHTTPTFACKTLPVLLNSLKVYVPTIEQIHQIEVADDLKKKVERMLDVVQSVIKEDEDKKKSSQKDSADGETAEPPDDFRKISVYPSAEEIVGGRGFLRENVVKGPYQNVQHYLDVQFRLLREDFVGPLRDGIANYHSSAPTNHFENVKVHKGIQFVNAETINEHYCFRIQFMSKKKTLNFEHSKRFMYGSLLCFTKDNFHSLIFGKVAQRKIEDLQKGQVIVAFDQKLDVDYRNNYLMVECSVYFEPYYHVLTVLQAMTEEIFPMERYIIRVTSSVQPPEYITGPECTYTIEGHDFHPLSEWPNENFYNFNDSQLVAFKAAITQEISVIQGPPGTGKTYLGLKVAETLLKNVEWWYNSTPMLVICFTNHALDQFLEGLIPFTKRIIRVGGQSKNTKLDTFNLRNNTERDGAVVAKRFEVQRCLREIKSTTEHLQEIEYYNSVLAFHLFERVVQHFSETWFAKRGNNIMHWLLEGANCGQDLSRVQANLNVLQEEENFYKIGINDDFNEYGQIEAENDFNGHFVSTFDSIFEEILNSSFRMKRTSFLITLSSIREELRSLEDTLLRSRQVENPSLQQLITEEETHFQLVELRNIFDYLKLKLSEGRRLQGDVEIPERIDLKNPYNMKYEDRWKLYFHWLNLYKNYESDVLRMTSEDFPEVYKEYEQMREIEDVRTMKDALVVGMTTTSAARLRSSLQTLKNPIVIVEEAAEVLEAHIVTSITKHCKHLILIGDHKQLRPNTANYSMEKKYRLGTSLFERMIINDVHCYTLNVQHRMRPEISCLIRPTIYDFLEDHPSVHHRPSITGIDNCVFFVDHSHPEDTCEGSSKRNPHEVSFFIYLARHLVLNGYNPANITILAAYLGQFFAFQEEKKDHIDLLRDMRIAVLDNYQGEESDIILLSLVRNNDENKIGFLSIENRVCVALSRAKNGLYIMGNMSQLCSDSKLWRQIKTTLEKQKALGAELPLRCCIHQDQVTRVKSHVDFYAVAEGGCSKRCEMDLQCGHKCTYLCHIRDRSHVTYKCHSICNKNLCTKDEAHVCKKMCYEDCGPCTYQVQTTLPCGHEVSIPCHVDTDTYKCSVSVTTELPCGHTTDKPCHCDRETYRCPHICDVQVQPCGHACELLCHIRKDPDHQEYKCKKPCAKYMKGCTTMEEDHRCKRLCHEECDPCRVTVRKARTVCCHYYDVQCFSDVDEIICEKPCGRTLQCGHPCRDRCNQPCRNCYKMVTKINPICKHPINVKCSEPADRKLCNKNCPLKLPCGHSCTKKCKEPCTAVCTVLVDCSGVVAQCGHVVTTMECNMAGSHVNAKLLVKYCKEPCRQVLKCGHLCSGSCGECWQGRVHKRCAENCGALLVCDHPCNFPCREACRPCKRICSYKCQHSVCRKSCGEVCTPCKEPCLRQCAHQWCTKFCGDVCNVPPCTEPCDKALKCGHPCIGFCGDPCPPKCLVCDRDELLDVFFGTESEDARYVVLNDCGHIVENDGMEQWLEQNEWQISYKLCPKCKTAIKTTQRYSDYIKRAIKDVAQVKIKANGNPREIREKMQEMKHLWTRLYSRSGVLIMYCPQIDILLRSIKTRLVSKKGKMHHINIFEAGSLTSKLQLIEQLLDICCGEKVVLHNSGEIFFPQVNFILRALSRDADFIANQEIDDISREMDRLARIVEFSCIKKSSQFEHYSANNSVAKSLIDTIEKHVFDCKQFTKENNALVKDVLRELNDTMRSGIAISDREKKEILRAMDFSKGHWYKCPNGHVYAIGECGGAMEESKCNECGAKIGGRNHALLNDNAVATEMDGATVGAWSAGANLLNYNMDDLQNF